MKVASEISEGREKIGEEKWRKWREKVNERVLQKRFLETTKHSPVLFETKVDKICKINKWV